MKKSKNKDAWSFWSFIPAIFIYGFVGPDALDVVLHDTYYVIAIRYIVYALIGYFFISGIAYFFIMDRYKYRCLKSIHFIFSYSAFMLVLLRVGIGHFVIGRSPATSWNILIVISVLLFFIAFVAYVFFIAFNLRKDNLEAADYL